VQIKNPSAGFYGEKRFLLAEMNLYSAIIAVSTQQGDFAFQAHYFGNKITMSRNSELHMQEALAKN
jgi:hypothetical protein